MLCDYVVMLWDYDYEGPYTRIQGWLVPSKILSTFSEIFTPLDFSTFILTLRHIMVDKTSKAAPPTTGGIEPVEASTEEKIIPVRV